MFFLHINESVCNVRKLGSYPPNLVICDKFDQRNCGSFRYDEVVREYDVLTGIWSHLVKWRRRSVRQNFNSNDRVRTGYYRIKCDQTDSLWKIGNYFEASWNFLLVLQHKLKILLEGKYWHSLPTRQFNAFIIYQYGHIPTIVVPLIMVLVTPCSKISNFCNAAGLAIHTIHYFNRWAWIKSKWHTPM